MKPRVESFKPDPGSSFWYLNAQSSPFRFEWHQHDYWEIVLITAGFGQRFVGDAIRPFDAEDLVLIPPNLPHTWFSAPESRGQAVVVVHFQMDAFGTQLLRIPECQQLDKLFKANRFGFAYGDCPQAQRARQILQDMDAHEPIQRFGDLLQVLDALAQAEHEQLATEGYVEDVHVYEEERVGKACSFIMEHYHRQVQLAELAELLNMNKASFSRFFHHATGKTFSEYIQGVRIGRACELLEKTRVPIANIAADVGFSNLSNFNRTFKKMKAMTPRRFRTEMSK